MKYLYLIFRLFFCGHKFKILAKGKIVNDDKVYVGDYFNLQCSKCGDVKVRNYTT